MAVGRSRRKRYVHVKNLLFALSEMPVFKEIRVRTIEDHPGCGMPHFQGSCNGRGSTILTHSPDCRSGDGFSRALVCGRCGGGRYRLSQMALAEQASILRGSLGRTKYTYEENRIREGATVRSLLRWGGILHGVVSRAERTTGVRRRVGAARLGGCGFGILRGRLAGWHG